MAIIIMSICLHSVYTRNSTTVFKLLSLLVLPCQGLEHCSNQRSFLSGELKYNEDLSFVYFIIRYTNWSKMSECDLPVLNTENSAAARCYLQITLAPVGAIIKKLAIRQDQNGKCGVWCLMLASGSSFPVQQVLNFVAVQTVLNQHIE
jgi:hypothetical protein